MTECFELIDRKLLKGPWVMGEQYRICDPRMAAGYSVDEKAKLLSARRTQNHGSIL
jgi:glutathione S-transferase